MKWGLTSNLTVSATVNPDFGQVEVDPAVVNLTAFETFFDEKRPFFLEGSQIFNNFGRGGANDFWGFNNSEPQIFYSRRIGRAPQLAASADNVDNVDYVDAPTATTILGAAKLTGKTSGRWSLGLLQAVTGEETARTSAGRVRRNRRGRAAHQLHGCARAARRRQPHGHRLPRDRREPAARHPGGPEWSRQRGIRRGHRRVLVRGP